MVEVCERILLCSHRLVDGLLFRLKPVLHGARLGSAVRLPQRIGAFLNPAELGEVVQFPARQSVRAPLGGAIDQNAAADQGVTGRSRF